MVDGMGGDEEACWLIAFCFFVWVWRPKKIHHTTFCELSLFLVLSRFSTPD
jgi:hypothetical protein